MSEELKPLCTITTSIVQARQIAEEVGNEYKLCGNDLRRARTALEESDNA